MVLSAKKPNTPQEEDREAPLKLGRTDLRLVEELGLAQHAGVRRCLQCRTCSGGCPFFSAMDYGPHGVMRLILMGQRDTLLRCNTIWLCVGCHTCSSACPMGIDIAEVMDRLRRACLEEGVPVAEPGILDFHREVLRSIEKYGRTHKLEIMLRLKTHQGHWLADLDVGLKMFAKRKLDLMPSKIDKPSELKSLFKKAWRR